MTSFREYRRLTLIPLLGVGLGAYYFFAYVPLAHKEKSLDAPLDQAWQKLASALEKTNATALDFLHITNQLTETRRSLAVLEAVRQKATARIELAAAVRAKMNGPFQLVDYENERSKQLEELTRLAKQQQTTVDPAVAAGFPEHTAGVKQPALLWAALSLIDNLLTTALRCKVTALHSLEVPLVLTNAPATGPSLVEIPLQVELTGPVASVSRLIQSLPLRAEEIRDAGLGEAPADKPPLLVDRLIVKKQSPDKPDEVRVWLRAIGFVLQE